MNFFQRHMTLKERIVLFLGAFFTALLFCRNAAENSVTGWLVTYFKDSDILTAAGLGGRYGRRYLALRRDAGADRVALPAG